MTPTLVSSVQFVAVPIFFSRPRRTERTGPAVRRGQERGEINQMGFVQEYKTRPE
jgi:hypothetical protein